MKKSYRDLEVYKLAVEFAIENHHASLRLPWHENTVLGSQVRRSAQSVRANIVEGYGRRRYKKDFIKFLVNAHSSCLETISHIEMINVLYPKVNFGDLPKKYDLLGAKLFKFLCYVESNWKT